MSIIDPSRDIYRSPSELETLQDAFQYITNMLIYKPRCCSHYVKQQIEYIANLLDYKLVDVKSVKTDSLKNDLTELLEHHEEGKKSNP